MLLFSELKRRNVIRVAAAYTVASWLVIQVVETIFPAFGFGDAAIRLVVIVLAIGILPVAVFAWAFELTPDGLKRESDVDRSLSITPQTGKKLDRAIMVALAVALGYFAVDKFVLEPTRDEALRVQQEEALYEAAEEAREEGRADALIESYGDKSIAVLPFADMSPAKDHGYMSDGIAEELLNLLTQVPELRVISRTSAFSFKNQELETPEIARRLNVGHILEGSVRTAGNQIRITAQLIEARSDTHLWSNSFDRNLDDIFAVQDEIAAEVVTQLKVRLLDKPLMTTQTDPRAYALKLQAAPLLEDGSVESLTQAIALLEQALAIDPDYAAAWSGLAVAYSNLSGGGIPASEGRAMAAAAADRALAIDPDSATALTVKGRHAVSDSDIRLAAEFFGRAVELEPYDDSILNNVALVMLNRLGRYDQSVAVLEWLADRDPLSPNLFGNLAWAYFWDKRLGDAQDSIERAMTLGPGHVINHVLRVQLLYFESDDYVAGLEACESLANVAQRQLEWMRLLCRAYSYPVMGREVEGREALDELEQLYGDAVPYRLEQYYAMHGQPDAAFHWLRKTFEPEGHADISATWNDWMLESLHDDPRWEELLTEAGVSERQMAAIEFEVPLLTRRSRGTTL